MGRGELSSPEKSNLLVVELWYTLDLHFYEALY
jgi:hypothetical protein